MTGEESSQKKTSFFKAGDYLRETAYFAAALLLVAGAGFWAGPVALAASLVWTGVMWVGRPLWIEKFNPDIGKKREIKQGAEIAFEKAVHDFSRIAGMKRTPRLCYEAEERRFPSNSSWLYPPGLVRVFNMYAEGIAGSPAIFATKSLLDALEPQEIRAVVAHEFGHIVNRHIRQQLISRWLHKTVEFAAITGFCAAVVSGGGAAILTSAAAGSAFFLVSGFVHNSLKRSHELWADRSAAELNENPLDSITALRKIGAAMEIYDPLHCEPRDCPEAPWLIRAVTLLQRYFFYSHPLLEHRCARLIDIAEKQGFSAEEINAVLTTPIDKKNLEDHIEKGTDRRITEAIRSSWRGEKASALRQEVAGWKSECKSLQPHFGKPHRGRDPESACAVTTIRPSSKPQGPA